MVNWDSFDKIWASTSPLTPYSFSDPNYSQGWNFVGSTPPARQMWDSIQKQNDEKFKYLRDNFGTPNIVTQASQMTDTDKVYVYMGSEAGWNSGHWYYYDEGTSSWADGGVYNSVAFVTDTTLSIAGQPADAKATGDALALKSDLAGCTFTGNVSVNADFSVTGDASIGTDLSVTGDSTLTGDVSALADLIVAGDSSLTNLSVSGTTALTGTSTAPTPSADDNSTKIATTQYVHTEIAPIETDVDIAQKDIANIKALLQGNMYNYQKDTSSAYTKTVPSGAMPYAGLETVGGKTIVWNQTLEMSMLRGNTTVYGVTSERTDNGIRLHGAFTSNVNFSVIGSWYDAVIGHKYLITNTPVSEAITLRVTQNGTYANWQENTPFTATDTHTYFAIRPLTLNVNFDVTWTPQIFDLTLMFGEGNEPTTYAEFQQMFPASYYAHSDPVFLSATIDNIVSKDSNNTTLQTFTVPASVQALEGYGRSVPSAYNYVDLETKKLVKNVAKVDMGTLTWTYVDEDVRYYRTDSIDSLVALPPSDNTITGEMLTLDYVEEPFDDVYTGTKEGISLRTSGQIVIYDADIQNLDGDGFASAMSGKYLYYQLATPVEVDISAYLTDDNLINVEAGGTITFENSNGSDYLFPVPSSIEYMIDLNA